MDGPKGGKEAERRRLAEALRANLKRRKAARAASAPREADRPMTPDDDGPPDGDRG